MPVVKRTPKIIVSVFIFLFLNSGTIFAVDDGFGPARKIEGKYFSVYYAPQLDAVSLARQLNVTSLDKLLVGKSIEKQVTTEAELADMLDTLFLQASDILDMHLYSFHGIIKICRDFEQLNGIYIYFFDKKATTRSFYAYSLNTIYTSGENFTRAIIAHEIAHAIISHYFAVQPSVKIQEVLAMYVEYQLKRGAQ